MPKAERLQPPIELTVHEQLILVCIYGGITNNKALAQALYYSEKSVKNILKTLYSKLGITERESIDDGRGKILLVQTALGLGFLEPPEHYFVSKPEPPHHTQRTYLRPREQEIMDLIWNGVVTNADLADKLVVSVSTIKNHLDNIYTVLGLQATETAGNLKILAVARCLQLGWLPAPDQNEML